MERREFIAGLGSAAAPFVWSKGSLERTAIDAIPRIAVVGIEPSPKLIAGFDHGMQAAGWAKV